jgi:hypothetical protein
MKKVLVGILLAGGIISCYATDARVITMGRHDNFFMDEVSIFKNPANINIYPNMVYGSYGEYRMRFEDTAGQSQYAALTRKNRDPVDPFFGSIVSYSLKQNSENRNQYPMVSLGAIFNRRDEMLDYITPGSSKYPGLVSDNMHLPTGKIDLLAGYVLENGAMLGVGGYLAFQSEATENDVKYETSVYKGNIGVNVPVAKSTNLEVSLGGGMLRAKGDSAGNINEKTVPANNDWFIRGDIRLFSALSMINGDFVPHFGGQRVNLFEKEVTYTDVAGGIGLNVNIDKGFFWAGVEGLYKEYYMAKRDTTTTNIGGRVSFGIERSIWSDWFVIRVGGQKVLYYCELRPVIGQIVTKWEENNPADASDNDLVSLGFGVNVENRLRVDFVAAEDIAYTFTNLVSGPQHHLFTRVSATYSF